MLDWFFDRYEDPAQNMPYESAEGGYQWIWGGPYDANEELQDEFADVIDFNTIQLAVERIQQDGHEWAPKNPPSDWFDDEPEPPVEGGFPYALPFSFGATGSAPTGSSPIAGGSFPDPARSNVINQLEELERLVRPLAGRESMIGHNNPPEPIVAVPLFPEAAVVIDATPAGRNLILLSPRGKPWKPEHLSKEVKRIARLADVREVLTMYDLRGNACTRLLAGGCSVAEIALAMGWSPETAAAMIKVYAEMDPSLSDGVLAKIGIGTDA